MEAILIKTLQLVFALSILVFVHELGHFMWARLFKVRVEKFYLFFDGWGKALWRWKPKGSETEYGIGWIPLGGYCKISGMVDESMDKEQLAQEPKPWEFRSQSAFKRFMIMVGGVLNNIITAILIYIVMMWYWGKDVVEMRNLDQGMAFSEYAHNLGFEDGDIVWSVDGKAVDLNNFHSALLLANEVTVKRDGELCQIALPDTMGQFFLRENNQLSSFAQIRYPMVVADVVDGGEAKKAGLQQGDSIVSVNGQPALYASEVRRALAAYAGDTILLGFYRNGEQMNVVMPIASDSTIGIYMQPALLADKMTHLSYNLWTAIPAGFERCYDVLYNYVRQFKLVFTKEGAQSLGGFGTMASVFPDEWNWYAFWAMTAFFSIALAFMNILPIPALDGGHIFFLLIEVITGRKPSDKVLEIAQYVGLFIVLALMIYVNANDIYKFIIKPWVG